MTDSLDTFLICYDRVWKAAVREEAQDLVEEKTDKELADGGQAEASIRWLETG